MDKNFVIAILLTTAIILIYISPFYQKRFKKEIPRTVGVEESTVDTRFSKRTEKTPFFAPGGSKTSKITIKSRAEQEKTEEPEETSIFTQINPPSYERNIILENDVVRISISSRGGVINEAVLKNFSAQTKDELVQLVTEGQSFYSGYIQDEDIELDTSDILFTINRPSENKVILKAELSGNKFISKEFYLDTSGYILEARTNVSGDWNDPILHFTWNGPINDTEIKFKQIKIFPFSLFMRDESTVHNKLTYLGDGEHTLSFNGKPKSVVSSKSQKLDAKKNKNGSDEFEGDLDWFAVKNKYFMTAAIPRDRKLWTAFSRFSHSDKFGKWFDFTLTKRVSNGATDLDIYMGPMSYDILKSYGRKLDVSLELSFRFIRPLSIVFLWFFKKIHIVIPNWGLVIIVFSIIIKVILYPLSKKSYASMKKMSALQPQINKLREKYKNNKQKLQQATMELYKKEGVNPLGLGGCLPMLLQMPVFFALYPVVGRAFELRHAMFIPHWIEDLSRPDPYYILPIAMGISMFFQSKATMKDPNQKAMLYMMPVMMVVLFANFSSGLTLYWFLFNILTYLQQKLHR